MNPERIGGVPFRSFIQGGFEGCTHRRPDRRQLDLIAATNHDRDAAVHYDLLASVGIRTCRDALRWHLIEQRPNHYDWSSFLPMLEAAREARMEIIWDLCHWGVPHHIDIWTPAFIERFALFAGAAAAIIRDHRPDPPVYCAINEISFWAWSGGDMRGLYPTDAGRGQDLKRQLVRASIAAIRTVKQVDPRARFVQPEPLINIVAHPERPWQRDEAEGHRGSQFAAWDMLTGRAEPELGGSEDCLDILGANFYFNNQWIHQDSTLALGHRLYRPLHEMLGELAERYNRPILISETGAEAGNAVGWLSYIMIEARRALAAGVPLAGVCLYPVMDFPGWDDDRHCRCGLIATDDDYRNPTLEPDLLAQLVEQDHLFQRGGLGPILIRRAGSSISRAFAVATPG